MPKIHYIYGPGDLVSSARRMENILYRQRSYLDDRIINEQLCLVRVRRQKLVLDQPGHLHRRCWS
jgi:hypothetical protein